MLVTGDLQGAQASGLSVLCYVYVWGSELSWCTGSSLSCRTSVSGAESQNPTFIERCRLTRFASLQIVGSEVLLH